MATGDDARFLKECQESAIDGARTAALRERPLPAFSDDWADLNMGNGGLA
jgi:hypothetical protein